MLYKIIKQNVIVLIIVLISCYKLTAQDKDIASVSSRGISLLLPDKDTVEYSFKKDFTIVCFFSIYCKPCLKELKAIENNIKKWKSEFNLEVIAISSRADIRYLDKIRKFAEKKSYSFSMFIDYNNELTKLIYNDLGIKKEKNFRFYKEEIEVLKPQLFILDLSGKVIKQKRGFLDGDENKIYKFLKEQ